MYRAAREKRRSRSLLLLLALLVGPFRAAAGDAGAGAAPAPVNPVMTAVALAGTRIVVPGEGLAAARLGDRLDILAADWGRPAQARKRGMPRRTVEMTYALDDFTVIGFRGRERVEEISIRGTPASRLLTAEGARFGMEPQQLIQLYGRPHMGMRKGVMEYPRKGISFAFTGGGLRAMAIYPLRR